MNTKRISSPRTISVAGLIGASLLLGRPIFAAEFANDSPVTAQLAADRKAELQERFARRLDEVRRLKDAGKIGETTMGYLEAVDAKNLDDRSVRTLLDEENADRRELYDLIAKEQKTTVDVVADRAARRAYGDAHPGDYFKNGKGEWVRKK